MCATLWYSNTYSLSGRNRVTLCRNLACTLSKQFFFREDWQRFAELGEVRGLLTEEFQMMIVSRPSAPQCELFTKCFSSKTVDVCSDLASTLFTLYKHRMIL